jgi:hypothetical protein
MIILKHASFDISNNLSLTGREIGPFFDDLMLVKNPSF